MIIVKLKGGIEKQYDKGATILSIAKNISEGLARAACAGAVDGKTEDLRFEINKNCELSILTFDDEQGRRAFRGNQNVLISLVIQT